MRSKCCVELAYHSCKICCLSWLVNRNNKRVPFDRVPNCLIRINRLLLSHTGHFRVCVYLDGNNTYVLSNHSKYKYDMRLLIHTTQVLEKKLWRESGQNTKFQLSRLQTHSPCSCAGVTNVFLFFFFLFPPSISCEKMIKPAHEIQTTSWCPEQTAALVRLRPLAGDWRRHAL